VGCLSFFPTKNLGCYGDGGMVVTNDGAVAETVLKLRNHGGLDKHVPETIGWNSRLDELQAAILLVKLRYVDAWNERRRAIASSYRKLLADLPLQHPQEPSYGKHVYHLYVIRSPERDRVKAYLDSRDIASAVYYPLPLHRTKPYSQGSSASLTESEKATRETLALPMFPEMTDEQVEVVAAAVREALS
jgi:dTDP-4-amino-4,6-dideoxygalactose transaminase